MTGNSVISGSWRAKIKNEAQLCLLVDYSFRIEK